MRKFFSRVGAVATVAAGAVLVGAQSAFAVGGADAPDLTAGTTSFGNGITDLQGFLWTLLPIMVGIALVTLVIRMVARKVRGGGK